MTPIEDLIHATAERFDVTPAQIVGNSRIAQIVEARHVAAYLIWKRYPELSFRAIASLLARRNHTTILHAVREVERRASLDAAYALKLTELLQGVALVPSDLPPTDGMLVYEP